MRFIHGEKRRRLAVKHELHRSHCTISVLFDQDIGDIVFLIFVAVVAVNKHDDVGVLLDGTRVAQVREARLAAARSRPHERAAREQVTGTSSSRARLFEGARDLSNLIDHSCRSCFRRRHELKVVDNDEPKAVLAFESASERSAFSQ
jgi:hypothetical protein